MKKWVKIVINKSNRITKINKNKNFEDFVEEDRIKKGHEEGGYTSNQYYKDKDIFFNYYLKGRCLILNNYLRDNLYSEKEILSLGAGRGINELSLISNNYNITCSDIEIPQCYEASKKYLVILNMSSLTF